MHFVDRLFTAIRRVGNPVVVGIDPRPEELPAGFLDRFPANREGVSEALRRFGCEVIDVVAPLVAAVKFQSAFYEAYGPAGRRRHARDGVVRPRKRPDRDHRRQTQRHRFNSRSLRSRLPG